MSIGNIPEVLSQGILAGIVLAWRLGVAKTGISYEEKKQDKETIKITYQNNYVYIYIYISTRQITKIKIMLLLHLQ